MPLRFFILIFSLSSCFFTVSAFASEGKSEGVGGVQHTPHPPHDHPDHDHLKKLDEGLGRRRQQRKSHS